MFYCFPFSCKICQHSRFKFTCYLSLFQGLRSEIFVLRDGVFSIRSLFWLGVVSRLARGYYSGCDSGWYSCWASEGTESSTYWWIYVIWGCESNQRKGASSLLEKRCIRHRDQGLTYLVCVSVVLCHQAFAMAGALAWQVTNNNKKNIFFVRGGFARGFARVLPSGVPCPAFSLSVFILLDLSYTRKSEQQQRQILWDLGAKGTYYQAYKVEFYYKLALCNPIPFLFSYGMQHKRRLNSAFLFKYQLTTYISCDRIIIPNAFIPEIINWVKKRALILPVPAPTWFSIFKNIVFND